MSIRVRSAIAKSVAQVMNEALIPRTIIALSLQEAVHFPGKIYPAKLARDLPLFFDKKRNQE